MGNSEANCVESTVTVQSRRRPTAKDLKDQPAQELANNYQQAHSTGKGVKVLINTIEVPAKGTDRCKGEPVTGYPCLDNSKCSTIEMSNAGNNSPLKDYGNGNLWAGGTEVLYDTKKIHPGCSCTKKHDGCTDSEGDRSQPTTRDWGRSAGSLAGLSPWGIPVRDELFVQALGPVLPWLGENGAALCLILVVLVGAALGCPLIRGISTIQSAITWCRESWNPRAIIVWVLRLLCLTAFRELVLCFIRPMMPF